MKKFISIWLPIIAWASLIFLFSSQPYQKQNIRPLIVEIMNLNWVSAVFANIQFTYADKIISVHTVGPAGFLEFCIRKGAHFFVFLILGFLLYRAFISIVKSTQMASFMVSLILVVIYAASDEYHQMYTEYRTPLLHDVILDISGGVIGIIFAFILYKRSVATSSKLSLPSK